MARKRTLDPTFWTSEPLSRLTREKRLFVVGLISNADDEGYLKGSGAWLKATIFPYDADITPKMLEGWRDEVVRTGTIRTAKVRGEAILWFPKWSEYQYVERPKVSAFRQMLEDARKRPARGENPHQPITEDSPTPHSKGPSLHSNAEHSSVQPRKEGESEGEAADPGSYKVFATRYYTATGRHPGRQKQFTEAYAKLCGNYGEARVLEALDEWAESRGGPARLKANKWAAKDFLTTDCAEICEGKRAEEKPAKQGEDFYAKYGEGSHRQVH